MALRTAVEFNEFYATPDPWGIEGHAFRNKALTRAIGRHVAGRRVLELGCGEAALTGTVFGAAALVHGVDISDIAIARARRRGLRHATFEVNEMLRTSLRGYDVIALIECLNYLSGAEREEMLARIANWHDGIVILSNPIIGGKYFTHEGLLAAFRRHGMRVIDSRNVSVDFSTPLRLLLGQAIRRSGMVFALDLLPEHLVRQRAYIVRTGG